LGGNSSGTLFGLWFECLGDGIMSVLGEYMKLPKLFREKRDTECKKVSVNVGCGEE
jgi:hypothetical protein